MASETEAIIRKGKEANLALLLTCTPGSAPLAEKTEIKSNEHTLHPPLGALGDGEPSVCCRSIL